MKSNFLKFMHGDVGVIGYKNKLFQSLRNAFYLTQQSTIDIISNNFQIHPIKAGSYSARFFCLLI